MHGNHHHHQRTDLGGIMSITSVFTIGPFVPCTPLQNPKYASEFNMPSQTKWRNVGWKTLTFFIQRLKTFFLFLSRLILTFFIFFWNVFYILRFASPQSALLFYSYASAPYSGGIIIDGRRLSLRLSVCLSVPDPKSRTGKALQAENGQGGNPWHGWSVTPFSCGKVKGQGH